MKVALLQPDRGVEVALRMPPNREFLDEDLELATLYRAMAAGDEFLYDVAKQVVPAGLTAVDEIIYRQRVLVDCLRNPDVVTKIYAMATEAGESRWAGSHAGLTFQDPEAILHRSIEQLERLTQQLRALRTLAEEHGSRFDSDGFTQLFATLTDQLDDAYLAHINDHIVDLRFPDGVHLSAALGQGNKGTRYQLHRTPRRMKREWLGSHGGVSVRIPDSDDEGFRALHRLAGRGIEPVATALSEAVDHVHAFLARLRAELGFYLGCVNLHNRLTAATIPTCFPAPACEGPTLRCRDLREVGLCLTARTPVVGNDIDADAITLMVITGANAGGKSTLLRSLGTAQVMMQAGMFVTAAAFTADVRDGIFTHYKRPEDEALTQGKLDEELARMREIVDNLNPNSLVLSNESFASTNEREGSRIARQVLPPLLDAGVKILFVTHLYELAHGRYQEHQPTDLFLAAQPYSDGASPYRLTPNEPRPSGLGTDAYHRILDVEDNGR